MRRSVLVSALLAACSATESGSPSGGTEADTESPAADTATGGSDTPGDAVDTAQTTWHGAIAPIVAQRCLGCHVTGGSAPFALDSYEAMRTMGPAAIESIAAGRMPPWMPDRTCREYVEERIILPEEQAALAAWVDAGMPEGETAPAPEPPALAAFEPTHVGRGAEPYTPNPELPDDWRCFVLDVSIDHEQYLTASTVVPDAKALVHHVIVYAVDGARRAELEAADAAEAGPGYTCFGGPNPSSASSSGGAGGGFGGGFPNQLGAWVPGIQPAIMPEGTAIRLAAGSVLVMQVHYNTLGGPPEPDRSAFQMRLTDTEPQWLFHTVPIAIPTIQIAAGDSASTHVQTFTNWSKAPVRITSATGHMHLLGSSIAARRLGPSGETCLLDIPEWDFNWQQAYRFLDDQVVDVAPGDSVELTCTYDNSAANQPTVNGQQIAPRDVSWGESTLDEMCLVYLGTVTAFEPSEPVDKACAPFADCIAACEDPRTADCLLGCADRGTACVTCVVKGAKDCAPACLLPIANDRECLVDCGISATSLGGGYGACLGGTCPDTLTAFTECVDPVLAAGTCDAQLTACGVPL